MAFRWPVALRPSTLPAPRSSRSSAARRKPAPRSENSFSAASRRLAMGVSDLFRRNQEIGVSATVGAAHAAPQLVELRQTEAVGAIDDDGVGAGNIQAVFDQGRGDEHVVPTLHELEHDALQFLFAHLAVRHAEAGRRHQALNKAAMLKMDSTRLWMKKTCPWRCHLLQNALTGSMTRLKGATMVWMARRPAGRSLNHRKVAQPAD